VNGLHDRRQAWNRAQPSHGVRMQRTRLDSLRQLRQCAAHEEGQEVVGVILRKTSTSRVLLGKARYFFAFITREPRL
jgi:hypothetical protein